MNTRFSAIFRKEFRHIFRDPRSLMIAILMPILMIFIYGHAIKFDIKNITLGINDQDRSKNSRELIAKFEKSGYFIISAYPENQNEIEKLFQQRKIKAAITIPYDYSKSINKNFNTKVQVIIDGSDSNTATVIMNYISIIMANISTELNFQFVRSPIVTESRVWYNPNLESANFIIPGLVAIILMMICALMTSITIAREKETGTLEQILVSPIRPFEITFGKVLPYVIIAFFDGALIVVAAKLMFGIPIAGSLIQLTLLSVVYLYASLSIGVFISTRVKTQQVAMMIALLATILPSLLLSGFIFPIRSMPWLLRIISNVVPAKYYLDIIRGIILKGIGFSFLWQQTLFLFILGTMLLLISVARFKTKLD
jgi:ABC-2 type transport system permease protein